MATEVCEARRTVASSPAPMALAITTLEPSATPMNRLRMSDEMGVLEPTAAMPSAPPSPVKWPTMTTEMRFESCSRMPVRATGRAKSGMFLHSDPVRICSSPRLRPCSCSLLCAPASAAIPLPFDCLRARLV